GGRLGLPGAGAGLLGRPPGSAAGAERDRLLRRAPRPAGPPRLAGAGAHQPPRRPRRLRPDRAPTARVTARCGVRQRRAGGQRAAEEMMATVRVAQQIGAGVVAGFTGSPMWSAVVGWPAPSTQEVAEGFRFFARQWEPILDVCREAGVRFAFEVHPGQIAYDL